MEDRVRLLDDPEKAGATVVEIEDNKETHVEFAVTSVPSTPELKPSSIDSPSTLRATDGTSTNEKFQGLLVAPRDSGWAAWRVLCGAILVQGILFAFPLTFGVFENFFGEEAKLSNATHSIWIGVLSTGVPFIGAPFMTVLCERYPRMKWRYYVAVGWVICTASLIGAAFSKSLLTLGVTQGALYGFGLLILDVPTLLILNTWFVKRRGLAYGLLFGACDLIGFGATILAEHLLRKYELRNTLLIFGSILLGVCGPAMWILQPRSDPISARRTQQQFEEKAPTPLARRASSRLGPTVRTRYYRRPIFYIFTFANLFHSFAYYLPLMYLPSYTTSLGYTSTRGAYLLAAANFAQIFGEVGFGQLSDRVNVHCLILACALVSSITTLALWGLAHSMALLTAFALIFGSFGSGFISLWARMGTYFGEKDAQMIYSIMSLGRGVGSIASGPISTALLAAFSSGGAAESGTFRYGNGKFFGLVLFVGISMAVSAMMGIAGFFVGRLEKRPGRLSRNRKHGKSYQNLKG